MVNFQVTGGANGFGREISFQFASLGCDIAIADIDKKSAMITVEDIKKQHPGVRIQWYQVNEKKFLVEIISRNKVFKEISLC